MRIVGIWARIGHGGKVHGNLLECPFHAWRYDGNEGVVKAIPYSKSIPPQVKRKCTRTWRIIEANGWGFAWYHPEDIGPLSRLYADGVPASAAKD